ncbi:Protein still life, isoform SIF type 1 [Gryllus bimaculatus]|nr:Protein still life, isoform SIF type 1 [Gryllus bimaculatus]
MVWFTMEEGQIAKVLQDFFTTAEGELSLQKGDIVQILKKIDKLWCFGCHNGRTGNMPLNYLIFINCPNLQDGEELFASIASFPMQQSGDLSFDRGELIVGVRKVDDNWWQGRIDARVGMFPRTYTWQLDSSFMKRKESQPYKMKKARVKKDLQAQIDEEIDLFAGDIVTVTEVVDKDWYRGESRGKTGIFPAAFVTLLNEADESSQQNYPSTASSSNFSAPSTFPNSDLMDGPPSYSDVFGTNVPSTSSFLTNNTNDMFDDDYFKQNAPSTFFAEQNDNQRGLLDLDQSKEAGIIPYGISLYPFHAQFDNELSFGEGEIVTLIRYISKDWMEGKIYDRKGIFPCNYVNVIVDCGRDNDLQSSGIGSTLESSSTGSCDLETESFAAVLYNFDAQMNSDISVKEGEIVYVMEQPNESWCKVRNQSGEIGLCPRNYLTLHVSQPKVKTNLFQRFSLANDNLLDSEIPDNIDHVENRRSYQPQDFMSGSHGTCSVDDLISLNIDNLKSNKTWHAKPTSSMRDLSDIFGSSSNKSASGSSDRLSSSGQSYNSVEKRVPSPAAGELDWQNNVSQPTSRQSSTLSLLDEPIVPATPSTSSGFQGFGLPRRRGPLQPSRFAPPVPPPTHKLKRQISDRVPHRPAPPVPLPGQKPMRRLEGSPQRHAVEGECNQQSGRNEIIAKENQLKYLMQMKEEILRKIDFHEDCNDVEFNNMKYQVNVYDEKIKVLTADLERLKGGEQNADSSSRECVVGSETPSATIPTSCSEEERRLKYLEQRQNVISELVMTEKEYVRDLKITFEVFNLHDPSKLESRGINVKMLFGNISEVMCFAEEFLDKLLFSMKGKNEDEQCLGVVFLEMADQMKSVYGEYCMNHDHALGLLEKYESEQEVQKVFNKGLETLRYQIACFDMSSILIKPVQRILKYPLILNELIKCTSESHKDKPDLLRAVKTIMDVATYINECKRRKDIVSKYLVDGNATISSKMSRLSLHSVAKKSTRFGMLVSSTLGFGAVTKDPAFIECETAFHAIEKTIRTFLKNIESFIQHLHEVVLSQCYIAEGFAHFYQERHPDVEEFARIQKLVNTQYFKEFIQEELLIARNNYQALNDQLLEELPMLVSVSSDLFEAKDQTSSQRAYLQSQYGPDKIYSVIRPCVANEALELSLNIGHLVAVIKKQNPMGDSKIWFVDDGANRGFVPCNNLKEVYQSPVPHRHSITVPPSYQSSNLPGADGAGSIRHTGSLKKNPSPPPYRSVMRTPSYCAESSETETTDSSKHRYEVITENKSKHLYEDVIVTGEPSLDERDEVSVKILHDWSYKNDEVMAMIILTLSEEQPLVCRGIKSVKELWETLKKRHEGTERHRLTVKDEVSKNRVDGKRSYWGLSDVDGLPKYYSEVATALYANPHVDFKSMRVFYDMKKVEKNKDECEQEQVDDLRLVEDELCMPKHTLTQILIYTFEDLLDKEKQLLDIQHRTIFFEKLQAIVSHYSEIPEDDAEPAEEVYYAMYDFQGDGVRTLSVKSGQLVKILQKHDAENNSEWWLAEDLNGMRGFVPGNFLGKHPN